MKIDSALKCQFLITPNIKNGTNSRVGFFYKILDQGLFCSAYLDLPFLRTKSIIFFFFFFFFFWGFFLFHFFFFFFFLAVFVTAISFCMTHHHDLKYVTFYLGSAQNSNFYPTIFLYIYWLK